MKFQLRNVPFYIVKILFNLLGVGEIAKYWYEKRAYKKIVDRLDWANCNNFDSYPNVVNKEVEINNTIWVYWKQGLENAPEIVKKCVSSIIFFAGNRRVVILTSDNIHEYVSFPDFIEEKHNSGIISEAHYSDLLRLQLLIQYGGIWMDATCFSSSAFPDIVESSPFFMFSSGNWWPWIHNPSKCSNWFIKSEKENELLIKVRNFLFEHWRKKKYVMHYFVFHFSLSAITENDKNCNKIWNDMPFISNINPHLFAYSFKKKYEEPHYSNVISQCFIHKLSYKFDKSLLNVEEENFLQHFMNK